MRILFLGDIVGRPGREAIRSWLPAYRREHALDFVIANAENAAGGKGVTSPVVRELFDAGIQVLTGGNHSFHQRDSLLLYDEELGLLRPHNLPPGAPGRGFGVFATHAGPSLAVINLQGRAFMKPIDCPFQAAEALVEQAHERTPIVLIDFHAEATSEKLGMLASLDGQVTAVIGTHTHVPTADAQVTPAGTAYITDVGMCGPRDSILGIKKEIALEQLRGALPVRHQIARNEGVVQALRIEVEPSTGRATEVAFLCIPPPVRTRR